MWIILIINGLEIPGMLNSKQTMLNSFFQGMKSSLKFLWKTRFCWLWKVYIWKVYTYKVGPYQLYINGLINPIMALEMGEVITPSNVVMGPYL